MIQMHLRRRRFICLFSIVIVVLAAVFLAVYPSTSIKIGYVGPLTGKQAGVGVAGRNGAFLATEEINAGGGIRVRDLLLLVRDDGMDQARARTVDLDLLRENVVAVVGHMTSAMTAAVVPIFNRAKIVLSPTTSTTSLSQKDDNFIRVFPSCRSMRRILGAKASTFGCRRLAASPISRHYSPMRRLW